MKVEQYQKQLKLGVVLIFLSAITLFMIRRVAGGKEGGGILG
jgi:hypothetical protein